MTSGREPIYHWPVNVASPHHLRPIDKAGAAAVLVLMSAILVGLVLGLVSQLASVPGPALVPWAVPEALLALWALAAGVVITLRRLRADDRHYFPPRPNSWGEYLALIVSGLTVAAAFGPQGMLLLVGQGSTVSGRVFGGLLLFGAATVVWIDARRIPAAYRFWQAHAGYP
jgi:hypothetical protein